MNQSLQLLQSLLPKQLAESPGILLELENYIDSPYQNTAIQKPSERILNDEPHIERWRDYLNEAKNRGIHPLEVLSQYIPQLRFPIEKGISASATYRRAVRQGIFSSRNYSDLSHLILKAPQTITLSIQSGPSGSLPIFQTGSREDFITLVRLFAGRNEPIEIADSMGACLIKGFNNWDRFRRLKTSVGPFVNPATVDKSLYQDTFIILSSGPYSSVTAESIGMAEERWNELSVIIRREHELIHYYTRRIYGIMQNNALDEIIADVAGVCAAFDFARKDLLLAFFGLENYPPFRQGGRLANYPGEPPLSQDAFTGLCIIVKSAVKNLSIIFSQPPVQTEKITNLFKFTLVEMAREDFPSLFEQSLKL